MTPNMLSEANLPQNFWDEAVNTAIYTYKTDFLRSTMIKHPMNFDQEGNQVNPP